jgi:hypothetical protein
MEIEMKTTIAALAFILLAASPTFAHGRHVHEGRNSAYVPQSGFYGTTLYGFTDTSRESMIHAN